MAEVKRSALQGAAVVSGQLVDGQVLGCFMNVGAMLENSLPRATRAGESG